MLELLEAFAASLARSHGLQVGGQPEDQLKRPVSQLIEDFGAAQGLQVITVTEVRVESGRPDIGTTVDGLLCGHLELKPRRVSTDPADFTGHNLRQWGVFAGLPNLIYTNGREWRLFRSGQEVLVVVLSADPFEPGSRFQQSDADELHILFQAYLAWNPVVPADPNRLAEFLAPLTRVLFSDVKRAVQLRGSAIQELRNELRDYLMPDLGVDQFSHAYAQGITYTLLLARLEGAEDLSPSSAALTLQTENTLLGRLLEILTQPEAYEEVRLGLDVLIRAISAVDADALRRGGGDVWLHFYEHFLHAYDPQMAADYGVYYTPTPIVEAQVRWVSQLLESDFGKRLGFAEQGVTLLDPAMGTGTYLVSAIQYALAKVRDVEGAGAVPARSSQLAQNLAGFEIMIGPYAVAYLRLARELTGYDAGGQVPDGGLSLHLADTLDSPYAEVRGGLYHRPLSEQLRRTIEIKSRRRVLVCLGNPPYDRHAADAEHGGGWIRYGDQRDQGPPLLSAFTSTATGRELNLQSLYNLYVYFWRWAIWKVLENDEPARLDQTAEGEPAGGIISYITASSFLVGPGFVGMREHMRREFDELWVVDLGGDNRGARRDENVFNIETPVAITVGIRRAERNRDTAAQVWYASINGTRAEKLDALGRAITLDDLDWSACGDGWQDPFLPIPTGEWEDWPLLTDLFPWQHSGSQFKRTWPIAPHRETLNARWQTFLEGDLPTRRIAFREATDRTIDSSIDAESGTLPGMGSPALSALTVAAAAPSPVRYGWRSFDRQWSLFDWRLGTYLKDALWSSMSNRQVFLTSLLTKTLGQGPGAVCTALIPDMDHFCGRGGKDVIPLFRDAAATRPNITTNLLHALERAYGAQVTAEDLFAYVAAVIGHDHYTERFFSQLLTPGLRIPLTADHELFLRGARCGQRLIWLQTFGTRFAPEGEQPGEQHLPASAARAIVPIPHDPSYHPTDFGYDEGTQTLRVGTGEIAPVLPAVWNYSISGYPVLSRWLGFRMRNPAGRGGSPLDHINASGWQAADTTELLKVIQVLEGLVGQQSDLEELLEDIMANPLIDASTLPQPTAQDRRKPRTNNRGGGLFGDAL